MLQPGRQFSASPGYRYGFNGKENDDEVKGLEGSHQDYGMRVYDPRLGRFLSIDPLFSFYSWYTPYQFAGNTPIQAIDLEGAEPKWMIDEYGYLTKPMIALLNSAFGFSKKIGKIPWRPVDKDGYEYFGQALGTTGITTDKHFNWNHRWMNLFEIEDPIEWVSMWANLIVHEGKHMDDMIKYSLYLFYTIYGITTTIAEIDSPDDDFDFYNEHSFWEKRAYAIEKDPTIKLFNFEDGLALKVLESNEYDDNTKSEVLNYLGIAFKLSQAKEELANSQKKNNRRLEKKISKLEKEASEANTDRVKQVRETMKNKTREKIRKPKEKKEYEDKYESQKDKSD